MRRTPEDLNRWLVVAHDIVAVSTFCKANAHGISRTCEQNKILEREHVVMWITDDLQGVYLHTA